MSEVARVPYLLPAGSHLFEDNLVLRVPSELSAEAKLSTRVEVRMILVRSGSANRLLATLTPYALAYDGFGVSIEDQASQAYLISSR